MNSAAVADRRYIVSAHNANNADNAINALQCEFLESLKFSTEICVNSFGDNAKS